MQIESRPMRSDPLAAAVAPGVGRRFRYLFYLDVVGNLADPAMQNALRHLQARPWPACTVSRPLPLPFCCCSCAGLAPCWCFVRVSYACRIPAQLSLCRVAGLTPD